MGLLLVCLACAAPVPAQPGGAPAGAFRLSVEQNNLPQRVGTAGSLGMSLGSGTRFSNLHLAVTLPPALRPDSAGEQDAMAYDLAGPMLTTFNLGVPVQAKEAGTYPIEISAVFDGAVECTTHIEYRVDAASSCAVGATTDSAGQTTLGLSLRNFPVADMGDLLTELLGTPFSYDEAVGRCRVSGSPSYGESTTLGALLIQLGLGYRKLPDGSLQACARVGDRIQPVGPNYGVNINVDNAGNFQLWANGADSIGLLDALFAKAGQEYVVDEPLLAVGVDCQTTGGPQPFETVVTQICNGAGYAWEQTEGTYHLRRQAPAPEAAPLDLDPGLRLPAGGAMLQPAPRVPPPDGGLQVQTTG